MPRQTAIVGERYLNKSYLGRHIIEKRSSSTAPDFPLVAVGALVARQLHLQDVVFWREVVLGVVFFELQPLRLHLLKVFFSSTLPATTSEQGASLVSRCFAMLCYAMLCYARYAIRCDDILRCCLMFDV